MGPKMHHHFLNWLESRSVGGQELSEFARAGLLAGIIFTMILGCKMQILQDSDIHHHQICSSRLFHWKGLRESHERKSMFNMSPAKWVKCSSCVKIFPGFSVPILWPLAFGWPRSLCVSAPWTWQMQMSNMPSSAQSLDSGGWSASFPCDSLKLAEAKRSPSNLAHVLTRPSLLPTSFP